MEPYLRDAVLVFILIVLLGAGVSSAVAYWQRRRDGTRYSRDD